MNKIINSAIELDSSNKGQFLAINGYESSKGELSNVVINSSIDYGKAKERDIKKVKECNINSVPHLSHTRANLELAKTKILASLVKPDAIRSKAQQDAYTSLGNGLRVHKESKKVSIYGLVARKHVIREGVYATTNKRDLTKAQDYLKKYLSLSTDKFRMYNFESIEHIRLNGQKIVL